MMSRATVILLAGPITDTPRLRDQLRGQERDLAVIAADSGIRHALELDLKVDLWVGDFDSTSAELAAKFAPVERRVFAADKDLTDGAIAIEAALERGAQTLILVGALGGAGSHAIGHTVMAVALRQQGIEVLLTSGTEEAVPLIAGSTKLDVPVGAGLSIIGYSAIQGLTLRGVRWPLREHQLALGSSRTISNEVTGNVTIEIAAGYGLAVVELKTGANRPHQG
jgi:thiamine pyrophosphokinase